ncbi:4-(cytidine 5'-phospho)-2-C-methyl-D-erithritol kinase [Prunus dulcis]|uniref:4-(Cytidine 5'-phospho)-2-C-methyl-D-erithritol kinase n=1 Tax=Prunus dulcis TaxID=3755 RepID=A0A4Y1REG7_PRUDU|nr:4-(cytidine 5'-phospho)-2-C-methyl-D-erithritol kinase [Prunus dulcis]
MVLFLCLEVEALLLGLVLQILPNSFMMTMNIEMCFCQRPTFSLVKKITGIQNLFEKCSWLILQFSQSIE